MSSSKLVGEVPETKNQKWLSLAALSSAILAVCAALSSLASNFHGNVVTRELIRNSNDWSYYQAKGIKTNLLQMRKDLLSYKKMNLSNEDAEKLKEYKLDQDRISENAKKREEKIDHHLKLSGICTRSVTFFQVAIGVVAAALLTRRRDFWLVGLGFGVVGVFFSVQVLILR